MNAELTFWDHISLALALLFVLVFIGLKIRLFLVSPMGGCQGCRGGPCGSGTSIENDCSESVQDIQKITINETEYIKLK